MEELKVVKDLDKKMMSISEFKEIENELNELENNSFYLRAKKSDNLFYEFNENPFSVIYFYYIDGKLAGYLDYWITFDSATIFRIGVASEYRRKGIASKLLKTMCDYVKIAADENAFITLEVRRSNEGAIALYEKNGFKAYTVKEKYYGDEDAIVMGRIA